MTYGPKIGKDEELHELQELYEELHSFYAAPNISRVIKSRRLRWAGQVARMTVDRTVYKVLIGNVQVSRPVGRLWTR
jgi:hypothetical protein